MHFNLSSIVPIAFLLKNVIIFIVRWVRCDGRKLSGTEMQMTILTFLPYFLLISFVHETTERDISPGNGNIDSRRNEREILAVYSPSRNAIIYNNTRIDESQTCHSAKPCRPGVLIPVWQPQTVGDFQIQISFFKFLWKYDFSKKLANRSSPKIQSRKLAISCATFRHLCLNFCPLCSYEIFLTYERGPN